MASIDDSPMTSGSPLRRHRGPLATLFMATCAFASQVQASELVIGRNVVQSIVASALFTDQGRWYLQKGDCYAYLENPVISLTTGRLVMNAHLSSRVGLEVGGSCVGAGFASDVQLSAKFIGNGSQVTLQDIRIDKVKDEATRQAVDILQSAAGTSLPRAVNVDLMQLLRPALVPGTNIKVTVAAVVIADVTTQADNVTVRFDVKLRAD